MWITCGKTVEKSKKCVDKTIKSKIISLMCCVLIMFALTSIFSHIVAVSMSKSNGITIVLDAGHGSRDGGSVGVNGTIEKEINLKYTLALKEKLVSAGYYVELTRENDEPLYSPFASNKKLSDMQARLGIIKKVNPNLVISIHMNSFPLATAHGATTYYRKGDESGKTIADTIQSSLHTYIDSPNTKSKIGDYYILNASYYTAVLIECGFISNPEEEARLNTDEYMNELLDAVVNGVILHFGNYQRA